MGIKVANFISTTITTAGGISAADLTVDLSDVSDFPSLAVGDYIYAVLVRDADGLTEIVKITDITGSTATIVRGQESTTPLAFALGDLCQIWVTRQTLLDLVSFPSISLGAPTGSSTSKSVSIQVDKTGYFFVRAWLVDDSTPSDEVSLVKPSGNAGVRWERVTDATGLLTLTITHTGASRTWYLCAATGDGEVKISTAITVGV